MTTPLQTAVQAVIAEWEKLGFATDGQMEYLSKALDAELQQSVEPVAWMDPDTGGIFQCVSARITKHEKEALK